MHFAVLLLASVVVLVPGMVRSECPSRCLCFRTTVRCMFLQLEKVPQVSPDTTILDLRFNRIKDIQPNTFKDLKHLNTLLLNNNHITKLQNGAFSGLKELRYLYLYKNRMREIESKVFQGLPKLEQLYLHYNKIEKLSPGIFTDLKTLERLFLHNNKLQRIPAGAFKNMEGLKRLRLDSNALVCDCEMMWLAKMLKEKQKTTQAAATCQFPTSLQGKSLAAVSETDFHCKKPKLTEEPHDVDVTFGGTVYFSCKAEGEPAPDIVWLRNSNEINFVEDPRYSLLTDGTLMIENAHDGDVGVFECMAKSPMGEVKSRSAKMRYIESKVKPHFLTTPQDQEVLVGSMLQLSCEAAGQPEPDMTWSRGDVPIVPSERYQISQEGTLIVSNIRKDDAGLYKCTAASYLGRVSSVAQVKVYVTPSFTERPQNQTVKSGGTLEFRCAAEGFPIPDISWYKGNYIINPSGRISVSAGGNALRIQHVKESDEGLYICRAQNEAGSREATVYLTTRERVAPKLLHTPYDMEAPMGSTIEIPCKADGEPEPTITWTKDGHGMEEDKRHRISPDGSLYVYNISKTDEGMYECSAANDNGRTSARGHLTVKDEPLIGPGDRYVRISLEEARNAVDKAVNGTLQNLFNRERHTQPTPSELLRLFRFPNAAAREVARSAEIYERTLQNIKRHVEAGMKFNLSEFSYKDLLSPSHLELVANMSGCMVHRPHTNCTDMCFHGKYRSFDGTCNNLQHPMWGASLTGFNRLLKPIYENGFNTPVGWTKSVKYFGYSKPSARLVSSRVITTDEVTPDDHCSHMLMQWGQFLDHDLDHAIPSVSSASFADGVDCSRSCDLTAPCFPIEIPPNDTRLRNRRCMEFIRSSAICGSGYTSVFFNTVFPREQINQLTAYIDGSQVYGYSEDIARDLRNLTNDYGLLRHGIFTRPGKYLLPFQSNQPIDCRRDPRESDVGCFLAGDIRANEQLGLLSMHVVWFREHNRVAQELRRINPHWDGDMLFHEARKVVGAEMQHITFKHWLPHILGPKGMKMLGEYKGYQPNVNPGIANVFATAAFRFGHSLINPILHRLNSTFQTIPEGDLPLQKAFFSPWRIVREGGIDPLLRGLITMPTKLKTPHQVLNSELTEHLFKMAHVVALDLAAINIQRGRDHALPGYNDWRQFCNLTVAETFSDLQYEIKSQAVRERLQQLYGHPGNIDVWVGGLLEDQEDGARVGPTFRCILVDQFRRLRDGDRFWYENPATFKPEQLTQIKQASLGRILCDNGDDIRDVTPDVFVLPQRQNPAFLSCKEVPQVDLRFWTECCHDCTNSGHFNTITRLPTGRLRRSLEHSYPEDKPVNYLDNVVTNISSNKAVVDNRTLLNSGLHLEAKLGERKTVLKQITDASEEELDEERIEGIETVLENFQKTLRQLQHKIRKLEHHCGAGKKQKHARCFDKDGKPRKNHELWNVDDCTTCKCESKQITCTTIKCPEVTCETPTKRKGHCCPEC